MIKLNIDSKTFINQIMSKVDSAKELTSPTVMQEIAKAAFTITGERFVLSVDREASQNPKKLHHIYEWGSVGDARARLFVIERAGILGGSLSINSSFLPSRVPVPVPSELSMPGRTGKSISAKNIFRNKASVMEKGLPISFSSSKVLSFLGTEGQVFVAPGKTITINHPGGMQTKNAFATFMFDWYAGNAEAIMDASGFYERVVQEASKVISSDSGGILEVRKAVVNIVNSISGGREIIK